jgi:hypothetical protein
MIERDFILFPTFFVATPNEDRIRSVFDRDMTSSAVDLLTNIYLKSE